MKQNIVKKTLSNGLRLIYSKNSNSRVHITVGVKVGLLDETPEINGVSHFLEHILWESTRHKTGKEIRFAVEDLNGECNACTGVETTTFYIDVPKKHFDEALALIASVVANPVFDETAINRERNVILNELETHGDYRFYTLDKLAKKFLMEDNMLGMEVIGSEESIKKINKELLETHYSKYYASNNLVVVVSGNVEDPSTKIEELFKLESKVIPKTSALESKVELPMKLRWEDPEASLVELAFSTVDFAKKESRALKVIECLLQEGKELSFMEEVRFKRGLTYNVHINNQNFGPSGIFAIGLGTEKSNIPEALGLIRAQIDKIQTVTEVDIKRAKKKIIKNFKENLKEPAIKGNLMADCELTNMWDQFENLFERINAVTVEDVKETAKKYLANNYIEVVQEKKEGGENEAGKKEEKI